jgi:GxxExxY protein
MPADLQRDPETYAIIGVAMTVHRELGHGFLESVYQSAFEAELIHQQIPFTREVEIPISYRGSLLQVSFRADFICYDNVIVELKALSEISGIEEAQVVNHLKATGYERALLINFGKPSLQYKRIIFSNHNNKK